LEDTANEIAPLDELLKSMANRVELARLALESGREDLITTILEDIAYGAQLITDEYCVKRS
jgi:phage shock protein A